MCSAAHLARKRSAIRRLDFERLGWLGRIIPGHRELEQGILGGRDGLIGRAVCHGNRRTKRND